MTFIYEPISEIDKQKIDFSQLKIGWRKANPDWWAVDRSDDGFLIWIIQEREPPHEHWYVFSWRGDSWEIPMLREDGPPTAEGKPTLIGKIQWRQSSRLALELKSEISEFSLKLKEAAFVHLQGECNRAPWGAVVSAVLFEQVS